MAALLNHLRHKMIHMQKAQPKIFIVEDTPVYQTLVLKQLEHISQDIHIFSTGENFLAELGHEPDLIILDYNLDGCINGYDVLKGTEKTGLCFTGNIFFQQPGTGRYFLHT